MTQPISVYTADAAIRDLVASFRQAAGEARSAVMADPARMGGGATDAITAAVAPVRQQHAAQLDAIVGAIDDQLDAQLNAVTAALPPAETGVEALLQRQAWWSRTQTLLTAHVPLSSVIATAEDPEQLRAILDEAPTQVAAGLVNFSGGLEGLDEALLTRMAQLAGPDVAQALRAWRGAQAARQVLQPSIDAAAGEIGGSDYRHVGADDFASALASYGLRPRTGR